MKFESKTAYLTLVNILVFVFSLSAQNNQMDGQEITSYNPFEVATDYANFSDCTSNSTSEKKSCFTDKLEQYFNKNLKMPKDSISQNFDGKIYFEFFTDTKGKLESTEIFNRPESKFIEEKIDLVLKKMPLLKVVQIEDTSVSTRYVLYAKFSPGENIRLKIIDIKVSKEKSNKEKEKITDDDDVAFQVVEDAPIFPGCEDMSKNSENSCFQDKITKHIRKNFNYPEGAKELGIRGRVNIMFVIDKDGYVKNIRTRGPHPLFELEARRIIAKLPQMTPGKTQGNPVQVPFTIPIIFSRD